MASAARHPGTFARLPPTVASAQPLPGAVRGATATAGPRTIAPTSPPAARRRPVRVGHQRPARPLDGPRYWQGQQIEHALRPQSLAFVERVHQLGIRSGRRYDPGNPRAEVALLLEPGDRSVTKVLARDGRWLVGHLRPPPGPASHQPGRWHLRPRSWFLWVGCQLDQPPVCRSRAIESRNRSKSLGSRSKARTVWSTAGSTGTSTWSLRSRPAGCASEIDWPGQWAYALGALRPMAGTGNPATLVTRAQPTRRHSWPLESRCS